MAIAQEQNRAGLASLPRIRTGVWIALIVVVGGASIFALQQTTEHKLEKRFDEILATLEDNCAFQREASPMSVDDKWETKQRDEYQPVTGLTATIKATGRPVHVYLSAIPGEKYSWIQFVSDNRSTHMKKGEEDIPELHGHICIKRDEQVIAQYGYGTDQYLLIPPSGIQVVDHPDEGRNVEYSVCARVGPDAEDRKYATGKVLFHRVQLNVAEMPGKFLRTKT